MPVIINKVKLKDKQDEKDPSVSNQIVVINVRKEEYFGIKPGQMGTIDRSKWGPYQFALKKVRDEVPAEAPKRSPNLSKPPGELHIPSLVKAFIKAAGGNSRAAIMLSVERSTLVHWTTERCKPQGSYADLLKWENLLELLSDEEKELLKPAYVQALEEAAKPKPKKKTPTKKAVKREGDKPARRGRSPKKTKEGS